MFRILLMVVLSLWCLKISAQEVTVPLSTDIVVIKGKSYYLHTVQSGQTLYSICKAYGVSVDEVKEMNDKKDNNLSLYEVLKVPFIEPFIQQDGKYWYHKVVKGETLYSIARHYAIKPKRLLKFNAGYFHNEPLAVGAVIKLPLAEIDPALLEAAHEATSVAVLREEPEEKVSPAKEVIEQEQISMHFAGESESSVPLVRDTLPIERREEGSFEESQGIPAYISEVVMPANPFVKVALMLPFSAREYPYYIDSMDIAQSVSISSRSEQFLSFYEGIILAVDSLKKQGRKIDLRVFDTERSVEKMEQIASQVNDWHPDLILGPVYGSVYKVMVEKLNDKSIPLVYPLSSRSETFGVYPNFIQVNASFATLAAQMANWLQSQSKEANLIHIHLSGIETDATDRKMFDERMREIEGLHFFHWNVEEVPLDSLRTLLLPDRENILVLPFTKEAEVSKILPLLSALADSYQITVLGLPEWQTFTSVDHETYYKLNTKIFTYSYVDYSSDVAVDLMNKYRKYFYTEPGSLVFKAFDIGMYFIDLAARYRDRTLEALPYCDKNGSFSKFHFSKMAEGVGKENRGFFIVNYSSDFHLKMEFFEGLFPGNETY